LGKELDGLPLRLLLGHAAVADTLGQPGAAMLPSAGAAPGWPPADCWAVCACMVCMVACMSCICLSSLAMRDFNSSSESFKLCTWPETASSLPLVASLCAFSFCCMAVTTAFIWLTLSVLCSTRC